MKKNIAVLTILLIVLVSINGYSQDSIINLNELYTYDQYINDVGILNERFPELIEIETIGNSTDNRNIELIKLGKGKTNVVIFGGIHAREIPPTPVIMKFIETYCYGYNNNLVIDGYNVKEILNKVTFYIVPLANPDGYVLATEGINKIKDETIRGNIKNISNYYTYWKSNANGVDLNRNFPVKRWGLIIDQPDPYYYKTKPSYAYYGGPYAGSEPETQALVKLLDSINFYGFIDFHSRGEIIYWEKAFESEEYNSLQKDIAITFQNLSGYKPVNPVQEIIVDGREGNTTDFVSEKYGKPAFTVETAPPYASFPIARKYFNTIYEQIKSIPLSLAKKAIELQDSKYYRYKVYQGNKVLKDFRTSEKANIYAEKYENTLIKQILNFKTINIDKVSPQEVGTNIKWTANVTGDNLKYRFYIYKDGKQVYKDNSYTTQNYLEYTPSSKGMYKAIVYAIDSNGDYDYKYSSEIEIKDIELKINKVSIDKQSPQEIGTKIKWTADAKGTNLKYRFYIYKDGRQVFKGDNYTTQNYLEYTPIINGKYKAIVYVIDSIGTYDYEYSTEIEIKEIEFKINKVSIDKENPQKVGTKIKWTTDAKGENLKYRFYIYKDGRQVYKGSSYSALNYLEYIPEIKGIYKAIVYVIDSRGSYDYKFSNDLVIQ